MTIKYLQQPLMRVLNAWQGLARIPKNSFSDQQKLLVDTKVKTIFDLGANIGAVSAKYSGLFPQATVYSFEPFPESFQRLRLRFEADSAVKPIEAAVCAETGVKKFYVNRDNSTNSLLPTKEKAGIWVNYPDDIANITVLEVPTITIDDFCKRESIGEIQILKMDIQGGELMALKGATEKLAQAAVSLIYTEMLFVPIYKGQTHYYSICRFLSKYGYSLFDMYNCVHAKNGQIKWCDAIFVSPAITF